MTCLKCKHCRVKDTIEYVTNHITETTYVCFKCDKYGETPLINVDNPEEYKCNEFKEDDGC